MTTPTEIRKRAIGLVEQLSGESLTKAVEFLEALSHEASKANETPPVEPLEEALLQIIQSLLSPEDQTRLAYLYQQTETGEITEAEYQELLAYVDRVECQDAERAEALIQLARISKVDLKTLWEVEKYNQQQQLKLKKQNRSWDLVIGTRPLKELLEESKKRIHLLDELDPKTKEEAQEHLDTLEYLEKELKNR